MTWFADPIILYRCHNISVEVCITVENQELVRPVISPGVAQLQCNPMCVGMLGHIEMKNPAPVVIDHKEAVQHSKRQCGQGEKVHRRNGLTMIAKKDQPPPSWIGILGRTFYRARYRSL